MMSIMGTALIFSGIGIEPSWTMGAGPWTCPLVLSSLVATGISLVIRWVRPPATKSGGILGLYRGHHLITMTLGHY